jgi:formate hydrogenlyase transcriptional activator
MTGANRFTLPARALSGTATRAFRDVVPWSETRDMYPAIERILASLMPYDYAAVAIIDERSSNVSFTQVLPMHDAGNLQTVLRLNETTPAGWVLKHQKPLLVSTINRKLFPKALEGLPEGTLFGCWMPMNRRRKPLGVLFVGSPHDPQLEKRALDLLLASVETLGTVDLHDSASQNSESSGRIKSRKPGIEERPRSEWTPENVIAMSSGFRSVMEQVRTVAPSERIVLLRGESGTEKEFSARLIHELSHRNKEVFIKLRCTGQPSQILERKLFGYEKDGIKELGRWKLAASGTLFLDEIADLPNDLQSKLVAAINERRVEGPEYHNREPLDARLLASTSRDLSAMVIEGRFNKDLYRLLSVSPIDLVPLRNRLADIPALVAHFVGKHARLMNKNITSVPQETMQMLCGRQWPGNVKELENVIERAVMLTHGNTLSSPILEPEALHDESLQGAERRHIIRILKESRGIIGGAVGAAKRLGVKRTTLNSKLKKLGIRRDVYR